MAWRIAFIGAPNNPHVRRWGMWAMAEGHRLVIVSEEGPGPEWHDAEWIRPRWTRALNAVAFGLMRSRRSREVFAHRAIGPALSPWRPQIVHGFDALNNGMAAVKSASRARSVVEPFGSDIYMGWRQGPREQKLVQGALRDADAVTCNLPGLGRLIETIHGFRPRMTWGFSWGVDVETFKPGPVAGDHDWRGDLGIPRDAAVLFSPRGMRGVLGREHLGAVTALHVFEQAAARHPMLHAIILMSSTVKPFDEQWRREFGRIAKETGRLHLVEHRLTPKEMASLYRTSDLVLSIPRTDLLSMCVLEAISSGCFLVAGGCHEMYPYLHTEQGIELASVRPTDEQSILAGIERGLEALGSREKWQSRNREAILAHHDARKQSGQLGVLYHRLLKCR